MQGDLREIVLLDVLPLSLGVETQGGLFTRIIEHNSTIPLKKTLVFTTVADNQNVVEIHVLQGERELAQHNRSLAKFNLVGIAAGPRGAAQIDVAFDMDANGILSVSAKDKLSGKEQAIRITPSTGLSKEEIERMIAEAKEFADSDRRTRKLAELHNSIKAQASAISRSYAGYGYLLDVVEQEMIKEAIQKAKDLTGDESDFVALGELLAQLENETAKLSAVLFNAPAGAGLQPEEWPEESESRAESRVNQLLKSALKDVSSKK